MSGYCPDCGNTMCICDLVAHDMAYFDGKPTPPADAVTDRWREKYYDKVSELNACEARSAKLLEALKVYAQLEGFSGPAREAIAEWEGEK